MTQHREKAFRGKGKCLRGMLGEKKSLWTRNHSPQQLLAGLGAFEDHLPAQAEVGPSLSQERMLMSPEVKQLVRC